MPFLQSNSIVVITCWYGPYPWYFLYFIHSCRYNPTIDFIIITDNKENISKQPQNVKIVHKTLEELKNEATNKLGFAVSIDYPYKLCDFRPAYGFLFPEIIQDYDFWGHGDIDVIYGDIRAFFNDKILNKFDFISVRDDYISSWFTLYRNIDKLNNLFKKSKDYVKVFKASKYFNFDETNFCFSEFIKDILYFDIKSEVESMTHLVKRLKDENYIRAYFDLHAIEGIPGEIKWDNGRLTYKEEFEIILYHLIQLKKIYMPEYVPTELPNTFYISPEKISS